MYQVCWILEWIYEISSTYFDQAENFLKIQIFIYFKQETFY